MTTQTQVQNQQNQQNQQIGEVVTNVFSTYDYSSFKLFSANRQVDNYHLNELVKSFEKNYLVNPILVNEDFYIVDGQHRFKAAQMLGLPIYYIINKDYGLDEVQILNVNMKNWGFREWSHYYSQLGFPAYSFFQLIMQQYQFGTQAALSVIKTVNKQSENAHTKFDFKAGELEIADEELAFKYCDMVWDFQTHYSEVNRSSFVKACLLMFSSFNYNHRRMLEKLNKNFLVIRHASSTRDYLYQLQTVYNHHMSKKNKLNIV